MKNFVTFEGCEGVGKSTQIALLKHFCQENGVDAVFTREPGGSKVAESIRAIILDAKNTGMSDVCEVLLYSAARHQHITDVVLPALESGKVVFCDRYIDSTFAYQGVARGLGEEFVDALNSQTVGKFVPELTLFLDLPPSAAFKRKGGVDKDDRVEMSGEAFFDKVYQGYKILEKKQSHRFVAIDATGTKEETFKKIVTVLKSRGII